MFFGRLMGWSLLGLALLLASGDAVLALEPGGHLGFTTGEMPGFVSLLLSLPAWTLIAPAGIGALLAFRPKRRRYIFRH
jgi:hypothetical protein